MILLKQRSFAIVGLQVNQAIVPVQVVDAYGKAWLIFGQEVINPLADHAGAPGAGGGGPTNEGCVVGK